MKLIDLINVACDNTFFRITIKEYGIKFESVYSAAYLLDNAGEDLLEMRICSIDNREDSLTVTIDK